MFELLYGAGAAEQERRRYAALMEGMSPQAGFPPEFSAERENVRIFSAPGRTELGGNHTDHNRGRVLAASIQMDAVAAAVPLSSRQVFFRSAGFPDVWVNLDGKDGVPDLSPQPEEQGTTESLVRGIAAEFARRGIQIGGFSANASSTVLPGSGLSSSAALEVLLAKIFDSLYGGGKCSPLELALISQKAENDYFGKPSGLMDQAASASGGAVAIDFISPATPLITKIEFDPLSAGFALCVVNTRGSHADLTPDYAAIPQEMNAVARYFGKSFLREIDLSQVLSNAGELRKSAGDRALLRAIHFFNEDKRAAAMAGLLQKRETAGADIEKQGLMGQFLDLVNESGDSSWELLQNLYSPRNFREQGLSLALAVSREFFREQGIKAACRVHGGGFAGTIQAYIPAEGLEDYRGRMEALFGPGALTVLRIRPVGAVELPYARN
ncbi:MAG: galactokinase [Treponema sp.]|jgi:galactokinase|nr:galactokinase [Treponema sp.]